MGKPITMTQTQAENVLREVFDKDKILLSCGEHRYIGSNLPPQPIGCKQCWEAYYWYMIATTPPHLRRERVEQAISAVTHANESYERGEFDFEPLARPIIEHTNEDN